MVAFFVRILAYVPWNWFRSVWTNDHNKVLLSLPLFVCLCCAGHGMAQILLKRPKLACRRHLSSCPSWALDSGHSMIGLYFAFRCVPWFAQDIAPESDTLEETNKNLDRVVRLCKSLQNDTGVSLLWNTSNMFAHPRFMNGPPLVFVFLLRM